MVRGECVFDLDWEEVLYMRGEWGEERKGRTDLSTTDDDILLFR